MAKKVKQTYELDVKKAVSAIKTLNDAVEKHNEKIRVLKDRTSQQARATLTLNKRLETFKTRISEANRALGSINRSFAKQVTHAKQLASTTGTLANRFGRVSEKVKELNTSLTTASRNARTFSNNFKNATINLVKANERLDRAAILLGRFNDAMRTVISTMRIKNRGIDIQTGKHKQQNKAVKQSVSEFERLIISWRTIIRVIAVTAVHRNVLRLAQAIIHARKTAQDFSIAIGEIRTIAGLNTQTVADWRRQLVSLSDAFGVDVLEAAEGAYQALSNQVVKATNTSAFLREEMRFAILTVSQLDTAIAATTSIINAWNLSSSDAMRVNQLLFATVERGRLRLTDIATTIGRVSILSAKLGVSIVEQNAAIALLTRQGVRAEEALTLLRNVQLKLIKPTKRMKEIFQELGVTSGASAIRAFGLVGTLERLEAVAKRGGDELADFAAQMGRVRAIIGKAGLESAKVRQEMIKLIEASTNTGQKFESVFSSVGKQLEIQFNRAKNVLINEFLVPFNQNLLTLIQTLGGAGNALRSFIGILQRGMILFLAYKGVSAAQAVTLSLIRLRTELLTQSNYKLNNSLILVKNNAVAAKVAMIGLKVAQIGITLGAALLIENLVSSSIAYAQAGREAERFGQQARFAQEQLSAEQYRAWIAQVSAYFDKFNLAVNNAFGAFNRFAAGVRAETNALQQSFKQSFEEIRKSIKKGLQDPISEINTKISELRSKIQSLRSAAQSRQEQLRERKLESDVTKFKAGLEGKSEIKQIQELNKLKLRLAREANQALARDDEKQADRLFRQVEKLQAEITRRLQAIRDAAAREEAVKEKVRRRVFDPLTGRFRIKTETVEVGKRQKDPELAKRALEALNQLERERQRIVNERIRAEQQFIARQEQRAKQLEQQAKAREQALSRFKELLAQIDAFDPKQKGAPKKFANLVQQADIAARAAGIEQKARIEFLRKANAQIIKLRRDAALEAAKNEIQIAEQTIKRLQDLFTQAAKETKAKGSKRTEFLTGTFLPTIAEIEAQLKALADRTELRGPGRGRQLSPKQLEENKTLRDYVNTLKELKEAREALNKAPKDEQEKRLQRVIAIVKRLIPLMEKMDKIQAGRVLKRKGLIFGQAPRRDGSLLVTDNETLAERKKRLQELLKTLQERNKELNTAIQHQNELERQLRAVEAVAKRIPQEFRNIGKSAVDSAVDQILAQKNIQAALEATIRRLERIRQLNARLGGGNRPPGRAMGGKIPVQYFSFGGRGIDRIPAMIAPGEIVMTQQASNTFAPLLHALNSISTQSRTPVGNITFGDINITVPQGTTDVQIDAIVQGLQRRARQGLLSL